MTARGIGKKPRSAAPGKRGGRRVVPRSSLAKRPRASQNKAGRYQPKPKQRKAPPSRAPAPRAGRTPATSRPREPDAEAPVKELPPNPEPRPPAPAMQKLMRGWPASWRERAQRAVNVFECELRLQKGPAAGRPFLLPPWQEEIVRLVHGPCHPDGRRICRTVWLEVGSKNAKSTWAAGMGLIELKDSGSGGAEVYSVARNRKQARMVFAQARAMAMKSLRFSEELTIFRHVMEVVDDELAKFEPLVSDPDTIDGVDPQLVIFDEVHRYGPTGADVVSTLEAKQATRTEPLMIYISTAGEYDPTTIAWEKHCYAEGVINGTIKDPTWVARIFTVPFKTPDGTAIDFRDESYWHLANPNLGISVSMEFLRAECRKATKSKRKEIAFRRFHLNQWVSGEAKLMPVELWDACPEVSIKQLTSELEGQMCASGLDLGSTRDLTAHVLVFPRPGGFFDVIARCFMPADRLEEQQDNDEVPYQQWAQEGWLTLTKGDTLDFAAVRSSILEDHQVYRLRELAFDEWSAKQISQELDLAVGEQSERPDDEQMKVIPFRQGYKWMSEPIKDFFDLVRAKKIRHGGNPLLRWMVSCATTKQDPAGNLMLVKPDRKTHKKRIDAVVALVMGLARAKMLKILDDAGVGRSVYETRGVRSL